jgi:hypothetical protein
MDWGDRRALDLKRALDAVSTEAQAYLALLMNEGALADPAAARSLDWTEADLERAAVELERALLGR